MAWEFWIDRGGTFTDIVARDPDGALHTHKLLSENPQHYPDAAIAGIRHFLGIGDDQPIPGERVDQVRMGTTVATNALLERAGTPTVLVVTRGFGDALQIGYQNRPRIFDRHIRRARPLYDYVVEVDERVAADGTVLQAPDLDRVRSDLRAAHQRGARAAAIACMHSYRYPAHEQLIAQACHDAGFGQISVSSDVSPLVKFVSRADTALVDAYLSPVLRRYVNQVAEQLPGVQLAFMQSSGGLAHADQFRGKDAVLSGPAGGIVAMVELAHAAGFDRVIGFDMGGTSTDVSHYAGDGTSAGPARNYDRVFTTEVAGVRLRAPMLAIHTVAAGGGSILHAEDDRYRVGPDSAGAFPGPACYRNGGPLTVTDANVLLGRIAAAHFPRVFGPDADQPLDIDTVRAQFAELADRLGAASAETVAEGFLQVAVANMANAVKKISIEQGRDVTRYALTTFGGAGGQHACAVADSLGIRTVLVPPMAGVLSALGIGLASVSAIRQHAAELSLDDAKALDALADQLADEAAAEIGGGRDVQFVRHAHVRYDGTDTTLVVALGDADAMQAEFVSEHERAFGFVLDRPLIVESVSVTATRPASVTLPEAQSGHAADPETTPMYSGGSWQPVPLVRRETLVPGSVLDGPAIVTDSNSTTVIDAGWQATPDAVGTLVLHRTATTGQREKVSTDRDPVLLEIFNNLFMSVAEQMGIRLEATAQSVNIKERLDFSCAIFDPRGNLVANAPHIPVHLGSMGPTVQAVIHRRADMRPGDVYAVNDPYHGGTHLPDITVITPVFDGDELVFYVASRGHHAEIGGLTPGSMPATSTRIQEEGVLFDNWLLVRDGKFLAEETAALLREAEYPSRNIETNLADLRAQVSANRKGSEELRGLIAHYGLGVVHAYMQHVQDNAEQAVRRVIDSLDDCSFTYRMDSGAEIAVAVTVDKHSRSATIDFTGTSPQLPTNYNAPSSVAKAAVLYVFRTLVDSDIPLNDGCLVPLKLVIPPGTMLSPEYPAAVVAGNVETSQAITAALYGALGVLAEGAGTMNNVTFGNATHQYYETLGSGSGAGPGFDGTPVVQTHMTNSRLTDPEILELRLPVIVEEFSIRAGSGGDGTWRGGDGATRRLRFTAPVTVSTLSNNRVHPPYGVDGGQPGEPGRNRVVRADGSTVELGGSDSADLAAGDVLEVRTPGGGGYGRK